MLAVVLPRCTPSVRAASAWLAVAPVLGVALLRLGGRPGTPLAPVVLIAEQLSPATIAALGPDFEVVHVDGTDREALRSALSTADAVLVRSATQLDAEAIGWAPRLKVFSVGLFVV